MAGELKVDVLSEDAFRRALSESGWLGGEVEAACMLRQGESPSMTSAMIGIGLVKLLKRKGITDLPRTFVLAVAADRVVAFDAGAYKEGEDSSAVYKVSIKPGPVGSWPRDQVSMIPSKDGITSNAVLHLDGTEMPCAVPDSDAEGAFSELEAALGGDSAPA
jgi:hypothetical protein